MVHETRLVPTHKQREASNNNRVFKDESAVNDRKKSGIEFNWKPELSLRAFSLPAPQNTDLPEVTWSAGLLHKYF